MPGIFGKLYSSLSIFRLSLWLSISWLGIQFSILCFRIRTIIC